MHFVYSHISFVRREQATCAISDFGRLDESPDKVKIGRFEIVTDGEVGVIDVVEDGQVCGKRRVILLEVVEIGFEDRVIELLSKPVEIPFQGQWQISLPQWPSRTRGHAKTRAIRFASPFNTRQFPLRRSTNLNTR